MSLGDNLIGIINSVFDNSLIPGLNLSESVTLYAYGSRTYSPASGVSVSSVTSSARLIFEEFSAWEVAQSQGAIQATDLKAYVLPSQVTTIRIGDRIYRPVTSSVYEIVAEYEQALHGANVVKTYRVRRIQYSIPEPTPVTAGTHDHTYMVAATGDKDGINTVYTVQGGVYMAGTLLVVHNGDPLPASMVTETNPNAGEFALSFAPLPGDDVFTCHAVVAL